MTWQLVKRDPAWRPIPLQTLALIAALILWHIFAPHDSRYRALFMHEAWILFLFAPLAATFLQSGDTRFQAILPVTVRHIFLSRMLAMFTLLWLPVIAGMATLMVLGDSPTSGLPLALWSISACEILWLQCAAIRGFIKPRHAIFLLLAVLFFSALVPDMSVSSFTEAIILAVCWLIAIGVVWRTWQKVPPSFQDAPLHSSSSVPSAGTIRRASNDSVSSREPLARATLRIHGFTLLPLFVIMLLMGTASSFWVPFLIFQWLGIRNRFRWLFDLPIPRRTLLAAMLLPPSLSLTAGYLVSVHLPPFPNGQERRISVRARQETWGPQTAGLPNCKTMNVLPSLDFWIPLRSGKTPVLQAPWGETFQPSAYRVSGFDIYNPYAVGCNNSERFLDWQFQRATITAFGHPLDRDKSDTWYIVDWHVFVTDPRTQFVNLAVIAGFLLLSTLLWMIGDWYRFRHLSRRVRIASMSLFGAGLCGLLYLIGVHDLDVVQWLSWTLPASLSGVIAVTLPALALLYLAIDRLFRQLEFVDKPGIPQT